MHRREQMPKIKKFSLNGFPANLATQMLGQFCYLFSEQFVVKSSNSGASFAWRQDGDYVGCPHKLYLSIWINLDDITEANSCLYVMPRNMEQSNFLEQHHWSEMTRKLMGYSSNDKGKAITCSAGSMIPFSSLTLHRLSFNTTNQSQRAHLIQYSAKIIRDPTTKKPKRFPTKIVLS